MVSRCVLRNNVFLALRKNSYPSRKSLYLYFGKFSVNAKVEALKVCTSTGQNRRCHSESQLRALYLKLLSFGCTVSTRRRDTGVAFLLYSSLFSSSAASSPSSRCFTQKSFTFPGCCPRTFSRFVWLRWKVNAKYAQMLYKATQAVPCTFGMSSCRERPLCHPACALCISRN